MNPLKAKSSQTWSIVIMCYNEENSILRVGNQALRVLNKISPGKNEILIVDDGSSDASPKIIREFKKMHSNVRAVFHPQNMGIGAALRSGYFHSRFENVCVVPADGQFNLAELISRPRLRPKTFLSFCRKKQQGYSLFRILLSRMNRMVNWWFLGIRLRDVNWVKVYKREELLALNLKLNSSLIESEICAKLGVQGSCPIEIPSVYHERTGGKAKGASLKIVAKALLETSLLIGIVWAFQVEKWLKGPTFEKHRQISPSEEHQLGLKK